MSLWPKRTRVYALICCAELKGPSCSRRLTNGASVRLGGVLADSPGKGQDKELRVEEAEILGACDPAVCFVALSSERN